MSGLTTLDAAKGMQRKHAKLMRDIDRVRSILPPDFAASAFIPDVTPCPSSSWGRPQNTKSCGWPKPSASSTKQTGPGPHIPALSIRKNRYAVVNEPLTAWMRKPVAFFQPVSRRCGG